MAHFAKLDENNVVISVNVINNNVVDNLPFPESEPIGVQFLTELYQYPLWKQTSYSSSFRKNYAGVGFIYDKTLDAFISPKPYSSWLLDTNTCQWIPPVPYPQDGKMYRWDEATESWVPVE